MSLATNTLYTQPSYTVAQQDVVLKLLVSVNDHITVRVEITMLTSLWHLSGLGFLVFSRPQKTLLNYLVQCVLSCFDYSWLSELLVSRWHSQVCLRSSSWNQQKTSVCYLGWFVCICIMPTSLGSQHELKTSDLNVADKTSTACLKKMCESHGVA